MNEPLKEIGVDFMKDPRLREIDDSLDRLFELTDCVVTTILDKENKMRWYECLWIEKTNEIHIELQETIR